MADSGKGTTLAKAYVQIMPSAKGLKANLTKAMGGDTLAAGKSAGESFAGSMMGALKKAIAVAGIGKMIKDAIQEGADYEQNIGGIETLFGESADIMRRYASSAYKTAGISANEYMQQSTSFAASLLSSLQGDTAAAAKAANQAVIDMADNANKMGTPLESIQNAYQGFAKQNYTMIDNLKLGYGGTKQEMERLLEDAKKISGVEYNIDNLSDVYSAIHVIQDELGITGTTAEEAASTLSGSLSSMQAAWKNLLAELTVGDSVAVVESLYDLMETAEIFVMDNLLPMVGRIFASAWEAVSYMVDEGLVGEIPANAAALIGGLLDSLNQHLPELMTMGGRLLLELITGIIAESPNLLVKAVEIVETFVTTIWDNRQQILDAGGDIVRGLWEGVGLTWEWLVGKIKEWCGNVIKVIKNFFGIHSPSRRMRDEVAPWLPKGLALGIKENMGIVDEAIDEMGTGMTNRAKSVLNTSISAGSRISGAVSLQNDDRVLALLEKYLPMIGSMKVVLDSGEIVSAMDVLLGGKIRRRATA